METGKAPLCQMYAKTFFFNIIKLKSIPTSLELKRLFYKPYKLISD